MLTQNISGLWGSELQSSHLQSKQALSCQASSQSLKQSLFSIETSTIRNVHMKTSRKMALYLMHLNNIISTLLDTGIEDQKAWKLTSKSLISTGNLVHNLIIIKFFVTAQAVRGQRGVPKGCHSGFMPEKVSTVRTELPRATVVRVQDWKEHLSNILVTLYASGIISRWRKRGDAKGLQGFESDPRLSLIHMFLRGPL